MGGDKETDLQVARELGALNAKVENMEASQLEFRDEMREAFREIKEAITSMSIRIQILESERAKMIAICGVVSTAIGFIGFAITNANAFMGIFK